ncbi:hypothetical protein N658DRAFT_491362 [Parathielavia hyrcaniae]|uniref:Uncharacterized protein n=1 Tax=Parathielavia hyrcaniae TaxID=113614 RepID=A0AAN6T7F1_9PEZI|nr:hypothetical protein N658DRAFT_491362 [Parathielavia hyrcaniae]
MPGLVAGHGVLRSSPLSNLLLGLRVRSACGTSRTSHRHPDELLGKLPLLTIGEECSRGTPRELEQHNPSFSDGGYADRVQATGAIVPVRSEALRLTVPDRDLDDPETKIATRVAQGHHLPLSPSRTPHSACSRSSSHWLPAPDLPCGTLTSRIR